MSKFDHLRGTPGSRSRLAAQVWEGARVEADPAEVPEPSDVPVPDDLRATIEHHMSLYPDRRSAVLPALSAAQREHGWLSPEAMLQVAAVMQFSPAYLESVASFYDMLELEPVGTPHHLHVHEPVVPDARRAGRARRALRGDRARRSAGRAPTACSTCARSSASAPATSRRWHRSKAITGDRWTLRTRRRSWITCARAAAAAEVLPEKLPTVGVPATEQEPRR